jgi:hypothetical protein
MNKQNTKDSIACTQSQERIWSIERQVRISSGLLVLLGISLAYSAYPPFIWFSIMVALGMVISGVTNSCALGLLIKQLPWNRAR